jgi:hypothetical protein
MLALNGVVCAFQGHIDLEMRHPASAPEMAPPDVTIALNHRGGV